MHASVACVIGDLSLIRPLGRAGIPVAVVTQDPRATAARSRYSREAIITPSFVDDPEAAVAALLDWGMKQQSAPVLYPQGDHDLLALSRQRAALSGIFRFVLPEAELVEQLVDKLRFGRLAQRLGLPVPETLIVERSHLSGSASVSTSGSASVSTSGSARALHDWERFPCVLKPAMRTHWFGSPLNLEVMGGNQKAIRIETRAELERLMPLLEAHVTDFVLQEAIPGGEEQILSYHAFVRPGGRTVAEFTGRKLRTAPRQYGLSTCVEVTDDDEVKAEGRAVVTRLDFAGVVKLDFKKHPDTGRLYLLEANPRFSLWHHPGALAGINIPALVYQDLVHPDDTAIAPARPRTGVRWVTTRSDLHAFLEYRAHGEISAGTWLLQMLTADVHEDLTLSDPLPGLLDLSATLRRLGARLRKGGRIRAAPAK